MNNDKVIIIGETDRDRGEALKNSFYTADRNRVGIVCATLSDMIREIMFLKSTDGSMTQRRELLTISALAINPDILPIKSGEVWGSEEASSIYQQVMLMKEWKGTSGQIFAHMLNKLCRDLNQPSSLHHIPVLLTSLHKGANEGTANEFKIIKDRAELQQVTVYSGHELGKNLENMVDVFTGITKPVGE